MVSMISFLTPHSYYVADFGHRWMYETTEAPKPKQGTQSIKVRDADSKTDSIARAAENPSVSGSRLEQKQAQDVAA